VSIGAQQQYHVVGAEARRDWQELEADPTKLAPISGAVNALAAKTGVTAVRLQTDVAKRLPARHQRNGVELQGSEVVPAAHNGLTLRHNAQPAQPHNTHPRSQYTQHQDSHLCPGARIINGSTVSAVRRTRNERNRLGVLFQ
jgi:hypothetical protein